MCQITRYRNAKIFNSKKRRIWLMKKDIIKYYNELDKHYESIWGKQIMEIKWMKGPYTSLPTNFHTSVYVIDETTNVMVTSGLSLCKTNERYGIGLYQR